MALVCTKVTEWIEEKVSKPVEEWEERQEKKCKKRKWYDPRKWLCWFVTILVKVIRWVVVTVVKAVVTIVCRVVALVINIIVDLLQGLWLLGKALVLWDKCILQEALSELGNVLGHVLTSVGYVLINPIVDQINRYRLKNYVREQIETLFADRPEHITALKDAFHLEHGTFGYRVTCSVWRMFVDSQANLDPPRFPGMPNLFGLHNAGLIDLYELAGFKPGCAFTTKEGWYRPRPQTATFPFATGGGFGEPTPPALEEDDLDKYIDSNGAEGPHFHIYSMSNADLDKKLSTASVKGRTLGLILDFNQQNLQVFDERYIKFTVGIQPQLLKQELGRIDEDDNRAGAFNDLCNPVAVGVFGFSDRIKRGQSTTLVPTTVCPKNNLSDMDTSGVTFVDDIPDELRKYVLVHELGHYYGLCHVDGFDRIMVSGDKTQGKKLTWGAIPNTLIHGGPRFTFSEAKQVWDYILANFPDQCFVPTVVIE